MSWDTNLAAIATNYAIKCPATTNGFLPHNTLRSSTNANYKSVGENIYANSANVTTTSYAQGLPNAAFNLWNSESANYNLGTNTCTPTALLPACGHYTQNVWATTSLVGCARVYCSGYTYPYNVICDFATAGNVGTLAPYTALVYSCNGISSLASNVCNSVGTCTKPNTCVCTGGYTGTYCQTPPPTCSGGCGSFGTCTATNVCTCKSGYSGANCQLATSASTLAWSQLNNYRTGTLKLQSWSESTTLMSLAATTATQCATNMNTCSSNLGATLGTQFGAYTYSILNTAGSSATTPANSATAVYNNVLSTNSALFSNMNGYTPTLFGIGMANSVTYPGYQTWVLIWSSTTPTGPNSVVTLSNEENIEEEEIQL